MFRSEIYKSDKFDFVKKVLFLQIKSTKIYNNFNK